MGETEPHPLNGTFAYFDSQLEIQVQPETTYELNGYTYRGRFTFTGTYSVELAPGQRYGWPVMGGTINPLPLNPDGGGNDPLTNIGYELAFVLFSPNVKEGDPTHGNIDLSRFIDSWTGYAGVDLDDPRHVNMIQLRFGNVTFHPADPPADSDASAPQGNRRPAPRGHVRPPVSGARTGAGALASQAPIRTAWSAFSWQPTWEDFGARSYIRIPRK